MSSKPARSRGGETVPVWPHGGASHTKRAYTGHNTKFSDQQLESVLRSNNDNAWRDGDHKHTEPRKRSFYSSAVFTQPRGKTLPAVYWLLRDRARPPGFGSQFIAEDEESGHVFSDKAVQLYISQSGIPSPPQRQRTVSSDPRSISLHRRALMEGTLADGGDLLRAKYRTPAGVEQNVYSTPPRRVEASDHPAFSTTASARDWLQTMASADASGHPAGRYPIPDTAVSHALPTPPRRHNLGQQAFTTMAAQSQRLGQRKLSTSLRHAPGNVVPTRVHTQPLANPLNMKQPDAHARSHYDDYRTPYRSVADVSMHPAARDARLSTAPPSSPPRAVYTGVPTAAPHPKAATPTAAPIRKPVHHSPSRIANSSLSSTYAVPTVASSRANPGLFQQVNLLSKRTTSFPLLGSGQGAPEGVRPAETMCLQYLSVQHDIPCSQRVRRDVLSTQHLSLLLQHHGGSASTPFTAPTLHEALSSFRNLMPLGSPDTVSTRLFRLLLFYLLFLLPPRFVVVLLPSPSPSPSFHDSFRCQ